MIIDELFEGPQLCPECGGISFSDLILAEKKDACYYKVKASAKVWPSAYASGRLVQCRKKGAANYGNKSEGVAEGSGQKPTITYKDYTLQYDYQTEDDDPEGYSTATTYYFDVFKDGNRVGEAEYFDYFGDLTIRINGKTKKFEHQHPLASQVSQLVSSLPDEQKRDLSDPKFESQGVAEQQELDEKWSQKYKSSINCASPKGFSQRAHCAGRKKNEDVAEATPPGARRDPYLEPNDISGTHQPQFNVPLIPDYAPGGARMPMAGSPKWTSTKIPGVSLHTGPPPKVTVQKRGAEYEPLASEVPAYVRQGKPDPVTVPKPGTKPKITVRPGETVPQAMQRTKAEQEFGQFLKGQSGQTFGAGAGRGTVNPPAAKSNAPKELTIDPNDPKTFTKQATSSNPEMDKIMKKWDQEQRSTPASLSSPSKSKTSPSKFLQLFGPDKMDEASRKKREQPEEKYDDEYDAMVARVKKLAGLGPMKTVYDPTKRVYRNMPTASQPKK